MEKRDTRIDEIINNLTVRNRSERIAIFIWGVFVYATAFSLFFSPQNIVTGGTAGLSLLVDKFLKIDTSIFVFIVSFTLLAPQIFVHSLRTFLFCLNFFFDFRFWCDVKSKKFENTKY